MRVLHAMTVTCTLFFALQSPAGHAAEQQPATQCGGPAAVQCGTTDWCDFPEGSTCGADEAFGTCTPRPDMCTQMYDPVCGCDGNTYSNACVAHAAGIDDATEGPCTPDE